MARHCDWIVLVVVLVGCQRASDPAAEHSVAEDEIAMSKFGNSWENPLDPVGITVEEIASSI